MDRRFLFLGALALAGSASAQDRKLNAPLARTTIGKVTLVEPTPDGATLVYVADLGHDALYGVPAGGGTARRLNHSMLAGRDVGAFRLDAASQRVVFSANRDVAQRFDLYSRPVDGSLSPERLNDPAKGSVLAFEITADAQRVVFATASGLFGVPLAGGAAQELDGEYVASSAGSAPRFVLDRGLAFFYVAHPVDGTRALFAAPVDASAAPTLLAGPLFTSFASALDPHPFALRVTPDGTRAVYTGDHGISGTADLFGVPVDGSAGPTVIAQDPSPSNAISAVYYPTGDGRVLFSRSRSVHVAPVDGAAPAATLHSHASRVVREVALAPDDSRFAFVSFLAGSAELRGGTLVPGGGTTLLATFASSPSRVRFSPDSQRVVFEGPGPSLYSVPADGSQPPVAISGALAAHVDAWDDDLVYAFSPDGLHAIFGASDPGVAELTVHAARIDGSAPPFRVHADLGPYADASRFRATALGAVAFVADGERDEVGELYAVPLAPDSPAAPLNLPFAWGQAGGAVEWFGVTPDAGTVAYVASQERPYVDEVYAVSLRDDAPPRRLSGELAEGRQVQLGGTQFPMPAMSPAGTRVLYATGAASVLSRTLESAPLDGSSAPVALTAAPLVPSGHPLVFAPGGGEVFFLAYDDVLHEHSIVGAPPDGSGPTRVLAELQCPSSFERFVIGGTLAPRLLYVDCGQLRSLRADLALPPAQLNPTPFGSGSVATDFVLSADGARVVFRCPVSSAQPELFSAPVDGSATAVKISGSLQLGGVAPVISPDGTRVLFQGRVGSGKTELYVAPMDGSAAPLMLSPAQSASGSDNGPTAYVFSGDGAHVAMLARFPRALYGVPVDRSSEPVKLSGTLDTTQRLSFLPDARTLVFVGKQATQTTFGLYRVPVTGGAHALLSDPERPVADPQTRPFLTTADGRWIVYVGAGLRPYALTARGRRMTIPLSGVPTSQGTFEMGLAPDDRSVVFRSYLEPGAGVELFVSDLRRREREAGLTR